MSFIGSSDLKQRSCLPYEYLIREQITPFKNFLLFYICRQSIGKSLTVSKSDPSLADSAEGDNSPSHTSNSSTSSEHSGALPTVSIQASSPENVDTSTAVSVFLSLCFTQSKVPLKPYPHCYCCA